MAYTIARKMSEHGWGFLGPYEVWAEGDRVGEIVPQYKTMNSERPYAYLTEVMLEFDALSDDSGYPNEYRTLTEAKAAINEMMNRNGIYKSARVR